MKKLVVLCIFISACSSLPRQYDGSLGYKVTHQNTRSLMVNNIQEHTRVKESTEQDQIVNLLLL